MSESGQKPIYRPKKLNLEMIADEFKLTKLGKSSQIDAILQYQRDYGLILKSVSPLTCMAVSDHDELTASLDDDGNYLYSPCFPDYAQH